jgi:hypothetical protein
MKAKGLAKVAMLYGQVERVRLVELQEAAAAVAEAEHLRAAAEARGAAHRSEGRAALLQGEGLAWRLAESAGDATEVLRERALLLMAERDVLRTAAGEAYRSSRLRTEQVTRVVEAIAQAQAVVDARREQAATDDRYAARLCWTRMKAS